MDISSSKIKQVIDYWDRTATTHAGYIAGYDSDEKIQNMFSYFNALVSNNVEDFRDSTGCDLGCWLGLTSLVLKELGAKQVYGIDIVTTYIEKCIAWHEAVEEENLEFRSIFKGTIPLQSESMDWVLINQVLCNALPASFERTLEEAVRILKPDGLLILTDSNNPHCQATTERLENTYRTCEIGTGSADLPEGSIFRARKNIIKNQFPDITADELDMLAKETCYLWGEKIVRAVKEFRETGSSPGSAFRTGSLMPVCDPNSGAGLGNITDPFDLAASLSALGMNAHISVTPVDARVDEDDLWEGLKSSQGFYIFARRKMP